MVNWRITDIPIHCINLKKRIDRWKAFQDQPEIRRLSVQRFEGVDGKSIDIINDSRIALSTKKNILKKSRRSHEEFDSVGGVGCALSHIAMWQELVNSEYDKMIIFEDDARVKPEFIEKIDGIIQRSSILKDTSGWDILLLGCASHESEDIEYERELNDVRYFYGAFAYVITKGCARRLLGAAFPIHCHIDVWMSIYKKVHGLRILLPKNPVATHGSMGTEIQTSGNCELCDIPSQFSDKYVFVSKTDWNISQLVLLCSILFIGYHATKYARAHIHI